MTHLESYMLTLISYSRQNMQKGGWGLSSSELMIDCSAGKDVLILQIKLELHRGCLPKKMNIGCMKMLLPKSMHVCNC